MPTFVMPAIIPNDGNSIPPWLFAVAVVAIVAVGIVRLIRRRR